jgi:hypothetical protein
LPQECPEPFWSPDCEEVFVVVVVVVREILAGVFTSLEQLVAARKKIDSRQSVDVFFIVVNFKLFIIETGGLKERLPRFNLCAG